MSRANASAYPETAYYDGQPTYMVGGLTIREEFAKAAMQGLLSHPHTDAGPEAVAMDAVEFADALIAELAKPVQS
jgi:hypothetical protein